VNYQAVLLANALGRRREVWVKLLMTLSECQGRCLLIACSRALNAGDGRTLSNSAQYLPSPR